MASHGPALSHLTMLSCTAPHRSVSLHPPIGPAPAIPLCTSPPPTASTPVPATHPIFPHGSILLLCHHHPHPPAPTVLAHHAISMVSWTPLPFPCLLQDLHFPRGPLPPRPFRLQLSPGFPPPSGAPSVPAVSAAAAFSSLCTFLLPCGPFSGRNGTFLHGSSRESRREQGSKSETRREKRVRWSGGRWGQGPGKAGGSRGCGRQRPGQRGLETAWGRGRGLEVMEAGVHDRPVGKAQGGVEGCSGRGQ